VDPRSRLSQGLVASSVLTLPSPLRRETESNTGLALRMSTLPRSTASEECPNIFHLQGHTYHGFCGGDFFPPQFASSFSTLRRKPFAVSSLSTFKPQHLVHEIAEQTFFLVTYSLIINAIMEIIKRRYPMYNNNNYLKSIFSPAFLRPSMTH
jgi:hypothetical protein